MIDSKLSGEILSLSVKVMSHTERVMRMINNWLIKCLVDKRISEEFCKTLHDVSIPFRLQLNSMLYDCKSFEQVEFDLKLAKLRRSLFG